MPFPHRLPLTISVLGLLLASRGIAADRVTTPYDVRDLLVDISESNTPTDAAARKELIGNSLIAAVRGSMPPPVEIPPRLADGEIIVTTTAAGQTAVAATIDSIRSHNGRRITLEARFITVNDDALAGLEDDLRRAVYGTLLPGSRHATTLDPADAIRLRKLPSAPGRIVKHEASAATLTDQPFLKRALASQPALSPSHPAPLLDTSTSFNLSAPRITLFSGQRSNITIESATGYVKPLQKVAGAGAPGTAPEIDTVSSGMSFTAQAATPVNDTSVALSIRAQCSSLLLVDNTAVDGGDIQVPHNRMVTFEGLYSLPPNEVLLIGNPQYTCTPAGDTPDPTVHTFLLVTATPE